MSPDHVSLPQLGLPLRQLDAGVEVFDLVRAPALHRDHGHVWVCAARSWYGDSASGPAPLSPAEAEQFVARAGRLSARMRGEPSLAPLVAWGFDPGRVPPWAMWATGQGRSLWHVRGDGLRLRPTHAAGMVAQVASGWLALGRADVHLYGAPTQVWLAEEAPTATVVEWLVPPVAEGPQRSLSEWLVYGTRDHVGTRQGFAWAVTVTLWLAQGGEVPTEGLGEIMIGDWLQPTALPEVDPALAVVMETARSDDPPAPEDLVERLWEVARSGPAPTRWRDVVVAR